MTKYTLHKQNIPCERCGEKDIRLYREYSTFNFSSVCMDCLAVDPDLSVSREDMLKQDSSGWWVPMLPTSPDDNNSCWGFSSSPDEAIFHYHSLKNSKDETHELVFSRFTAKLHEFKEILAQWKGFILKGGPGSEIILDGYASRYDVLKTFNEMLGKPKFQDWY